MKFSFMIGKQEKPSHYANQQPMTQLHELLPGIYALEVPMDASDIQVYGTVHRPGIAFAQVGFYFRRGWEMPPGNWSIICCSATATEEEAGKVIAFDMYEDIGILAANYMNDGTGDCKTRLASLASLIRSRGLDPEKNWLILKLD